MSAKLFYLRCTAENASHLINGIAFEDDPDGGVVSVDTVTEDVAAPYMTIPGWAATLVDEEDAAAVIAAEAAAAAARAKVKGGKSAKAADAPKPEPVAAPVVEPVVEPPIVEAAAVVEPEAPIVEAVVEPPAAEVVEPAAAAETTAEVVEPPVVEGAAAGDDAPKSMF